MKSKILYQVTFWYGLACLVFALLAVPGIILLYRAQNISLSDFTHLLASNTFFENIGYFASLSQNILFTLLVVFISLALIRGKAVKNKMTDVAAGIFSFVACLSVVTIIVGIASFVITYSIQIAVVSMYDIRNFGYPAFPVISLVAIILLTVSYVNEKLAAQPRKYFQIILPALALLTILLVDISKVFHL